MFTAPYKNTLHLERHYNLDFLKDYYGDDMSEMTAVLKLYLQETPKELQKIEMFLLNQNHAGAKASTHRIKTNIAMLGIIDPANFIHAMHDQGENFDAYDEIVMQFKIFKAEVLLGMRDIEKDFFTKKK